MATAELGINIVARNQAKGVLKGIKNDLKGMAQMAGSVALGNALTAGVSAATRSFKGVVGMFASMSMEAAEFNAQISTIGSVSGATTAELEKLKTLATDLGMDPRLKVSAEEAAASIEMLARNGLKVPDILNGAAEGTVLLANATKADFSTAADVATDAMAQFGIDAEDMMTAVDGVASVVRNSKIDIDGYRLAIGQAGGTSAASGVSFEDFNTTMAAIVSNFAGGSDAGTGFKTFLQRLVPTTDRATEYMKELGLITADGRNQFYDATGQMKSMADISTILNRATRDLTEIEKNRYLTTIFGTDAIRAAVGLAAQGEVVYTDLAKASNELGLSQDDLRKYIDGGITGFEILQATMEKTDAVEMARTNMDNLAGDISIFQDKISGLRKQIGDEFDPALRQLFQGLTGYLSQFSPQIVELAGYLADAFIAPGIDAFIGKMSQLTELMGRAQTLSGGIFAALGDLTGGDVTIDASGLVTEVRWGDFIGTLDWSAYIFSIEWGNFIAVWNWEDKIAIVQWGEFIAGVDWDDYIFKLQWSDYIALEIDWDNWVSEFQWGDYIATFDIGNRVSHVEWRDYIVNVDWSKWIVDLQWGDYVYQFAWSDFVSSLNNWSVYVSTLTWGDVVAKLSDWGVYIKSLDWKNIIATIVDWSTWIPALSWFAVIKLFEWTAFIAVLEWKAFVSVLNWDGWVGVFSWDTYVSVFSWDTYVPALEWIQFISSVAWSGFITKLEWLGIIEKPEWANYLRSLSWADFVELLNWASWIVNFSWSEFIGTLAWSSFVTGVNLRDLIPTFPGWDYFFGSGTTDFQKAAQGVSGGGGGGGASGSGTGAIGGGGSRGFKRPGGNARGTDFWEGGWTWVGEKGPELLNLPRGARVLSNQDSMGMIGQLADGTTTGPVGPSRTGGIFNELAKTLGFTVSEFRSVGATWSDKTEQLSEQLTQNTESLTTATDTQLAAVQASQAAQAAAGTQAGVLATSGELIRVSAEQFARAATQSGSYIIDGIGHFTESFTDLLGSFGDNLQSALQNVPGLFGSTQVTADQMRLAELGIDQNFADDWLRRLTDEVMNGVDWEGVDIEDAARRAGLDASLPATTILELVTKAWNDKSLFADKANLDLFNMDAVQAELMRQQASAAGNANILALFGITPEQATQAGVSAGTSMRAGVSQGLMQPSAAGEGGADGASLTNEILGGISTDEFAVIGTTAIDGILGELNKPENGERIVGAFASMFSKMEEYGDIFTEASMNIMRAISAGIANSTSIDITGDLAKSMLKNLQLEDSINTLRDVGERILEYVYRGYSAAAEKKDWAYATVGSAPTGDASTNAGNNAIGTRNWRGGMTWVGETGPELVALPRGSRIFSNGDSMAMAGGGGINVTVNVANVSSNIDIDAMAYRVADAIQRRRR